MTVTVVPDAGNHLSGYFNSTDNQGGICRGGLVLVTEFRGMALIFPFGDDVLRPLHLVPLNDFTYKYHPAYNTIKTSRQNLA